MQNVTRQGGALLAALACGLLAIAQPAASQTSLPSGWSNRDIGSPAVAGSATESAGTFTVKGAGLDIWDSADQFHFAYQTVTGDTQIVAYVASLQSPDEYSKAGVMIRAALTGSAAHGYVRVTEANGWRFNRRLVSGGTTYGSGDSTTLTPGWVRLVREGNVFTAYRSQDGSSWTLLGTDTITMPATVYVGLAVGSKVTTATATAAFSNVAISSPSAANKPPTVSLSSPAGGAQFTAPANISIAANAGDVDGSVAQVEFFAGTQLLRTDTSSPYTATWNSVAAGTYSLTAVATDNDGAKTTSPAVSVTVGTATNQPPTVSISAPAGGTYPAPASMTISATAADSDGSVARVEFYVGTRRIRSDTSSPYTASWTNVAAGSYSLTAVATDNDGARTTSAPVAVTVTAAANKPPTVSISAPAGGASYTAPASITISATAADTDGSVAKVEFYQGTTLLNSDTSSPFSFAWSNVAAGSYSLTAVATDNAGARTTSAAVAITVQTVTGPKPSTLKFVAPVDYATNVTSFAVQLRRSTDAITATPVATRNLGKPAIVSGEISVDISTLVDPLPTGSYYAVVVTTGPGGSTSSAQSAAFSK